MSHAAWLAAVLAAAGGFAAGRLTHRTPSAPAPVPTSTPDGACAHDLLAARGELALCRLAHAPAPASSVAPLAPLASASALLPAFASSFRDPDPTPPLGPGEPPNFDALPRMVRGGLRTALSRPEPELYSVLHLTSVSEYGAKSYRAEIRTPTDLRLDEGDVLVWHKRPDGDVDWYNAGPDLFGRADPDGTVPLPNGGKLHFHWPDGGGP